jgi:hypothetical protein
MNQRIPDGLREMLAQATDAGHLPWRALLKPGDWLLLVCVAALVAASYPLLWRGGVADRAIVRRDGQLVTELALNIPRKYEVTGAIGTTVIEVQPGRARVLSDPGSAPVLRAAGLADARQCRGDLRAEPCHAATRGTRRPQHCV